MRHCQIHGWNTGAPDDPLYHFTYHAGFHGLVRRSYPFGMFRQNLTYPFACGSATQSELPKDLGVMPL